MSLRDFMPKKRTKAQKNQDFFDAFKCIQKGTRVKRSRAKDGSIPTHPVVEVMPLKEKDVLAQCLTWLRMKGIIANRNNVGSGQMGESGFYSYGIKNGGDIIGLLPHGRHLEVECKAGKGGRLSAGQQQRMKDILGHNGLYFVIHGIEELKYFMKGYV